jgi:hypothetical protein
MIHLLVQVIEMTMHLIQGMTSNNTKKRKLKRSAGWQKRQNEHNAFLKKMKVSDKPSTYRSDMPDLSVRKMPQTSDSICSNGLKKEIPTYTGNEIAGIVTTHKSNLMPIRKDNKNAAIDAANMRR